MRKFLMIELNISGAEVSVDKVVMVLAELSVEACVSQTSNVCRAEEGFRIEPGAHITMPNCTRDAFVQAVWPALKETFALRCGWMDASTKSFRGCTENYIRESSCPVVITEAPP